MPMHKEFLSLSRWWILGISEKTRLILQIFLSIVVGFAFLHIYHNLMTVFNVWYYKTIVTATFALIVFMKLSRQATAIMKDYFQFEEINAILTEKNSQLNEAHEELHKTVEKLKELSVKDPLTGVYNRLLLYDTIVHASSQAKRRHEELFFLYFDLNKLKDINDVRGHAAGDMALVMVTKIILGHIRSEERLFRLGGDEFFLAVAAKKGPDKETGENFSAEERISRLAERISDAIKNVRFFHEAHEIPLSISIGIHRFNSHNSIEDEIDSADKKMYEVKIAKKRDYASQQE